jgi:hypothetical protein
MGFISATGAESSLSALNPSWNPAQPSHSFLDTAQTLKMKARHYLTSAAPASPGILFPAGSWTAVEFRPYRPFAGFVTAVAGNAFPGRLKDRSLFGGEGSTAF